MSPKAKPRLQPASSTRWLFEQQSTQRFAELGILTATEPADALKEFILSHRVIHADETPVALLAPGKGKTKKAYVWVYRTTNFTAQRAVYYDFCNDRSGEHPRRVLHAFTGTLVSDDYAGQTGHRQRGQQTV